MSHQLKYLAIKEEDYFTIKEIYDYYIVHSTATFHTEPISIHELQEFIFIDNHLYPAYIIHCDGVVAGYCYLTYFKKRQAYNRTAEITLYLKPEFCDKGIGHKVVMFLETEAKKRNLKNLIAVISGNNYPSIKLFEKSGYTKCAHFKNVGEKQGQILDVVDYQKEI
jgi:L-amino acid N-acyltransferase YncA